MPPRKPLGRYAGAPGARVLHPEQAAKLTAGLRAAISGGTPCNSCMACAEYGSFMAAINTPRARPSATTAPVCVGEPAPA